MPITRTDKSLRVIRCSKASLNNQATNEGCLYFTQDTNECYFDNGTRHRIGDIEFVDALPLAPIADKLYFNRSDNTLNAYVSGDTNSWKILSADTNNAKIQELTDKINALTNRIEALENK